METVTELSSSTPPSAGSAITIGVYDGVHLGHQAVLAEVRRRAGAAGLVTTVVTFDRHPASVVRPDSAPLLLSDLEQRLELLEAAGVERTVVVPFDEERANETAEDFVSSILVDGLRARLVVVGEDFHFGHGRKGNVALLREMGKVAGFTVEGLSLHSDGADAPVTAPISSTRIRGLVAAGRVEDATTLLGRPHQVRGPVVRGDQRGGDMLGFPTANVNVPGAVVLPASGVYAGRYERPGGEVHEAAVSVGRRPTFYGDAGVLVVEAFLLDFTGNLYGEVGRVSFVARLRDELSFDSTEALVTQMHRDVADVRTALGQHL